MEKQNKKKKEQKGNTKRLILLDSHAILHRAYHALPDFASSKGEPTGALYGLVVMLTKIIADLKPDYIVACFDLPQPTYRHEAYEEYKAGRKKTDDALVAQIKRSQDVFAAFNIPVYSKPGFEADDMLGTIVEQIQDTDITTIIASGDMDTLQLVSGDRVSVYTLKKGINDTILYTEDAVLERFGFSPKLLPDYKGLRGDPSDNIIGIKGIGEKTATTLISQFGTIEEIYKVLKKNPETIKKAGITDRIINLLLEGEEEALFSKMLATIRRDAPITFEVPEKTWKEGFDETKTNELFQNLEFRKIGARLHEVVYGTKTEEGSMVAENTPVVSSEDLEETALALWVLDSNITAPTIEDILAYAHTKDFAEAKQTILQEIADKKLQFVYEQIEMPLIPIIKEMDARGVKIDKQYLLDLSKTYRTELHRYEKRIWEAAGEEFNINSPKQLGEILFTKLGLGVKNQKKTATGMKSTKESELEKLKDDNPIIGDILAYRELQKLLSTYIDTIVTMLDENDRLHTSLRQAGTTTGRMSSNNPNLQNIPIKTELGRNIRSAFIAEKGYTFVSFDYSQIELRVAAILSKDETLLSIFRNGEDVHESVAAYVFGVAPKDVDKEMRRKAKVINFGILYGMGVNALRQNLGGTREEAQQFYNEYFKRFSGLAQYLDDVKASALKLGYTETLFGRRRYFEGLKSKLPFIRAAAERMAINAPIQGTAADIMKLAMKGIAEKIKSEGLDSDVRMLLQVHDELIFEIKNEKVSIAAQLIKEEMEQALPDNLSEGIICSANGNTGSSWGEMKSL